MKGGGRGRNRGRGDGAPVCARSLSSTDHPTGQHQSTHTCTNTNSYAPPFLEAVKAGVRTAMECYIEVGGVPMVSNREYLIDLLRHEMGFEVR